MEPEFRSGFLHDYTTLGGKLRIFLNRLSWKWILPGIFFVALVIWAVAFDKKPEPLTTNTVPLQSSSSQPSLIVHQAVIDASPSILKAISPQKPTTAPDNLGLYVNFNPTTGKYKASGIPGQLIPFTSPFSSLPNKLDLTELYLSNVQIDAPSFSANLQGCTNIRKITFDRVTVVGGNYSRVYLPNLTHFDYQQNRLSTKVTYITRDEYRTKEKLKSIIFFDVDETSTWDVVELLNLKVNVKVTVGGTTLVNLNRQEGSVSLNVDGCHEYLEAAQERDTYKRLTLSWCNTTAAAPFIPQQLTYLNLNNAVPQTSVFQEILKRTQNLQEFHAFLPYLCENASWLGWHGWLNELQVEANLVLLPATIRNLTISKLQITAHPLPPSGLPIRNLVIEQSNVSGIVQDFQAIFPNLTTFVMSNLTHNDHAYGILDRALKIDSLDWILLEDFRRRPSTPSEEAVEGIFTELGVPDMASHILITARRDSSSGKKTFVGQGISEYEKDVYRYNLFGFSDVDDYQDYLIWDAHWNPHW